MADHTPSHGLKKPKPKEIPVLKSKTKVGLAQTTKDLLSRLERQTTDSNNPEKK